MALSAAEGKIGPGLYSSDASFIARIRGGEFLTRTNVTVPGWCIDGRPADEEHSPLPRSAGATIGLWAAQVLAGEDISLADFIAAMETSDEPVAAHTGPTSSEGASGCGAADHLLGLMQIIASRPQEVRKIVERWGIDPSLIDQEIVNSAGLFQPDNGDELVQTVADYKGTRVPHLLGDHNEAAAVVNLRPNTTLDTQRLDDAFPGAQVFHIDAWLFGGGTKPAATLAAVNAATLLMLASTHLPYIEVQR